MPIPNNFRPLHKKKRHSLAHRQKMARKKTERANRKPWWMENQAAIARRIRAGATLRTMRAVNGVGRPSIEKVGYV